MKIVGQQHHPTLNPEQAHEYAEEIQRQEDEERQLMERFNGNHDVNEWY